jgi:hypothetical protein
MHRRELLTGVGALASASLVWKELLAATDAPSPASARPFLDVLCDLVIPDGATPGAKKAGVPAFIILALQHHLAGASKSDLTDLQSMLDQQGRSSFIRLPSSDQRSALIVIDFRDAANPATAWSRIKKLILMGYYTSEIGASQELQYQLVPGRFDSDLPVKPGDRAWSSDWIGQGF